MKYFYPNLDSINNAYSKIKKHVHKTPVLKSEIINEIAGCNILFKCENFQKVGAFKYRGATNAVLNLSPEMLQCGVATHSSGNHAAALALAAKISGTCSYIVMPKGSPEVKIEAVKHYGGLITFCENTLLAREEKLKEIVEQTRAVFVHPYDNPYVISGQGTVALELMDDYRDFDFILAPVGGGGLMSGVSIAVKSIDKNIKVIGTEPELAKDAYLSFKENVLQPAFPPVTLADGLRTSLSELTFDIIKKNVDEIFVVSENKIIEAMKIVWQYMKIIIEPSSAVPLAVILENKDFFKKKNAGIIISGGNVELSKLPFANAH